MPDTDRPTITAADMAAAARRAAVTLGSDRELTRLYSSDVIGAVLQSFVLAWTGAGSMERAAERMANDPAIAHVPEPVVEALMHPCMVAFARAIGGDDSCRPT